MFAKTIVLSDAFLDMPLSARCLYFTLGMLADDDGFVNSPKSIMRQSGASMDDLNILIGKRFLLTFDSGVIVIKHWRIHNYIQKDRYKETKYLEEKNGLSVDENGAYKECIQNVSNLDTQVRVGKGRLELESGEDSIGAGDSALSEAEKALVSMWREHGITLTIEEARELEAKLTPQVFDRYFHNLDNFLRRNPTARTGSQYELILRWAREDGAA